VEGDGAACRVGREEIGTRDVGELQVLSEKDRTVVVVGQAMGLAAVRAGVYAGVGPDFGNGGPSSRRPPSRPLGRVTDLTLSTPTAMLVQEGPAAWP
jgi:hypothetical protein